MKFIHLSDLHLGLTLNGHDFHDDQEFIFNQIIDIINEQKTDGVIIAGDIYDSSIPPVSAVNLFDNFLTKLVQAKQKIFIISGNHDSADRVSFGNQMLKHAGVYIAPIFNGKIEPIKIDDEFGPINIFLLPFVKPIQVKHIYENEKLEINSCDYDKAMQTVIQHLDINKNERNILVTHQFVGAETKTCDSEYSVLMMGNIDRVSATVFADFDYVALGHIHGPQNVTKDGKIRYCGTPLKYSFSEADHKKSASIITFGEKNQFILEEIPLKPLHDVVKIEDTFDNIINSNKYDKYIDDYVSITLIDEDEIVDDKIKIDAKFNHCLEKKYNNSRTQNEQSVSTLQLDLEKKTPFELFNDFYFQVNSKELSDEQKIIMQDLINDVFGGNE